MKQKVSRNQNELVLICGGSLALEVLCFIKDINANDPKNAMVVAYVIDATGGRTSELNQIEPRLKIVKSVDDISCPKKYSAVICIGDATLRWKLYGQLSGTFASWKTIIHPTANIMASAQIGDGAIIAPNAYVGPMAKIGVNSFVNVGASIGHDASIGHSAVVSPQAAINGFASCGTATFVGAAATLLPSARLGSYCKLSAGSVFSGDATNGFLLHGNPAKGRQMFRFE